MKVLLCPSGLVLFHFFNLPTSGFSVVFILTVSAPERGCRFCESNAFSLPFQLCLPPCRGQRSPGPLLPF